MNDAPPRAVPTGWLVLLLLAPVAVHAAAFAWEASTSSLTFSALDRIVLLATVAYVVVVALAARRRALLPKLALVVYSALLAVAAAELALPRLLPPPPEGLPWPPMARRMTLADTMPGVSGDVRFTVNRYGLRGPEAAAGSRAVNILCVGGSTTECLYIDDPASWPWRLQDQLAERTGQSVFVGNSGRSGLFSLHHIYLLEHYEPVPRFNWAVVLCGVNDLGVHLHGVYDIREPRVPSEMLFVPDPATEDPADKALWYRRSVLVRAAKRALAGESAEVLAGESAEQDWRTDGRRGKTRVYQDPQGKFYAGLRQNRQELLIANPAAEPPPGLDAALARYERNLRRIVAACRERGVKPLLLTQPTMWRADLPPELDRLLWQQTETAAYRPAVLATLMDRFNQVVLNVAREERADVVDLAARLPKDGSVFYDDCHFTVNGCRQVADALCEFFAERVTSR